MRQNFAPVQTVWTFRKALSTKAADSQTREFKGKDFIVLSFRYMSWILPVSSVWNFSALSWKFSAVFRNTLGCDCFLHCFVNFTFLLSRTCFFVLETSSELLISKSHLLNALSTVFQTMQSCISKILQLSRMAWLCTPLICSSMNNHLRLRRDNRPR